MSIYRYLSGVVEDALAEYFVDPEAQRYDHKALEWKRLTVKPDILFTTCNIPVHVDGANGFRLKAFQAQSRRFRFPFPGIFCVRIA